MCWCSNQQGRWWEFTHRGKMWVDWCAVNFWRIPWLSLHIVRSTLHFWMSFLMSRCLIASDIFLIYGDTGQHLKNIGKLSMWEQLLYCWMVLLKNTKNPVHSGFWIRVWPFFLGLLLPEAGRAPGPGRDTMGPTTVHHTQWTQQSQAPRQAGRGACFMWRLLSGGNSTHLHSPGSERPVCGWRCIWHSSHIITIWSITF